MLQWGLCAQFTVLVQFLPTLGVGLYLSVRFFFVSIFKVLTLVNFFSTLPQVEVLVGVKFTSFKDSPDGLKVSLEASSFNLAT